MKKFYNQFMLLLFLAPMASAQVAADYAVQLTAIVQESPAQIKLTWTKLSGATSYTVYRKAKSSNNWGTAIAALTATDSAYTDANVIVDSAYEYKVLKTGGSNTAVGYIYAGIKAPAIHDRGALLLLVDSTFTAPCAVSIKQLMNDISGDGWQVLRLDVGRAMRDTIIRNYIKALARTTPLKAVFILGHVAVPYSGNLNPDGHPDHLGAWPADVYYADTLDTYWQSDAFINNSTAGYPINRNIPHDGKWDVTTLSTPVALQVGRVDFYNMPAFTQTEVQLMESYLQRAHLYKMDSLGIIKRALISDNFGAFSGEAFAANGWRNFSPLVGRDSIKSIPFIASLNKASYQWAYGCGGGTFTSASGIGATGDFVHDSVNGIFTMLFGSYFGDWNTQNNFLRAPLCANIPALTSCWAGRPNWYFHHMALGENIGYAANLIQNNAVSVLSDGIRGYQAVLEYGSRMVHIALMGDLTLRTDYINPPANLVATYNASNVNLSWLVSFDPDVIGYYVYRSSQLYGHYEKISSLLTNATFTDNITNQSGLNYYMVRAVKLQSTPSGNYYNLSIGVTDTVTLPPLSVGENNISAFSGVQVYPNPGSKYLNIAMSGIDNETVQVKIINIAGQSVMSKISLLHNGNNLLSLDTDILPAGIYLVIVQRGKNAEVAKWTKYD